MIAEMTELTFIVLIYSLVAFILIFIYGLFIFFKLRRQEKTILNVKRKLDALFQNSDLNVLDNENQYNQNSSTIQGEVDDNKQHDNENVELIKNTLKESKRYVSPVSEFIPTEEETEYTNEPEIEDTANFSEDYAELKDKIIATLGQFDKAISFEHFSKRLSEDNSFAGKHNLAFDLIDHLKEEGKINVYFVGGKLLVKLK